MKQDTLKSSPKSPEVASKEAQPQDSNNVEVKVLSERLSGVVPDIRAKDDLVKQHFKVAEEAVLDSACISCTRMGEGPKRDGIAEKPAGCCNCQELNAGWSTQGMRLATPVAKEEQDQKVQRALAQQSPKWESNKTDLELRIVDLKAQLEAKPERSVPAMVMPTPQSNQTARRTIGVASTLVILEAASQDTLKSSPKSPEVASNEAQPHDSNNVEVKLNAATVKNSTLDGALKECVWQLRCAKEEQDQKVQRALAQQSRKWESDKTDLELRIVDLKAQLEAKPERSVTSDGDANSTKQPDCEEDHWRCFYFGHLGGGESDPGGGLNQIFIDTRYKEVVSEFAKLAGVPIAKSWSPNVTHVVASTDPSGACKRTLKFLMAILNGKWIVFIDWVKACMDRMEPAVEQKFEVTTDVHGQPKLLNGMQFYLHGD
ncbi:hypothetical protein ZWY2020_048955 [Hordeum vulgare]|nr:hypothetical protein ZWY2020_048955 [Hordeum vulgare]